MELELKAQAREEAGRRLKTLREKGFIPAVVYGPGHKPVSIQVNYEDFRKVFDEAGESTLLKLKIQKPNSKDDMRDVLIHDIAKDPVTDKFIHIDFYQVRMDKVITAEVPLVFEGEAPAVKNLDGVLVKNITEVEVEALPKDLPHEIKVDISSLDSFDKHIRTKDLKLSPGVKILADLEEVIISVEPPRTEEELKELEEKPEVKVEEVEKVGEPSIAEAMEGKEVEPSKESKGAKSAEVPMGRDEGGKKK
ncbi:MAG: 50S ribosomal protein L25 [Patescibacteria group bacterium]